MKPTYNKPGSVPFSPALAANEFTLTPLLPASASPPLCPTCGTKGRTRRALQPQVTRPSIRFSSSP